MINAEQIRNILTAKLSASRVDVEDESNLHKGHQGAMAGGGHFRVTVVSDSFKDKPTLERHRMVYAALETEMGRPEAAIHALALKTIAPGEAE